MSMSPQQPLFSQPEPHAAPPAGAADASPAASTPAPVWLQRLSLVVLVLFCLYIGVLMAVIPWSPRYWDDNHWLLTHPAVDAVLQKGWARGFISGMGLLDIWVGVSEAVHYRDYRPANQDRHPDLNQTS